MPRTWLSMPSITISSKIRISRRNTTIISSVDGMIHRSKKI
jgi:hypothetical protein